MPATVNGFGTSLCGSRGDIGWGSCDAMEWIVALYMPLIPISAVHTFAWNGNRYRAIPIRWSFGLVVRSFLSRWVWGMVFLGGLLTVFGVAELNHSGFSAALFIPGFGLLLLATFIGIGLRLSDRRNKAIRLVLGSNTVGNCDPAFLPYDTLYQTAGDPRVAFGTDTFAQAAEQLLRRRAFARAMWAARVCVLLEDAATGESLTDQILRDPEVVAASEQVRRKRSRWEELMFTEAEPGGGRKAQREEAPREARPAGKEDRVAEKPRRPRGQRDEDDY